MKGREKTVDKRKRRGKRYNILRERREEEERITEKGIRKRERERKRDI